MLIMSVFNGVTGVPLRKNGTLERLYRCPFNV